MDRAGSSVAEAGRAHQRSHPRARGAGEAPRDRTARTGRELRTGVPREDARWDPRARPALPNATRNR